MYSFKVMEWDGDELKTYTGLVPGTSFKEALNILMKDNFVEDLVESVELKYITESTILMAPEGIVDVLREENNV